MEVRSKVRGAFIKNFGSASVHTCENHHENSVIFYIPLYFSNANTSLVGKQMCFQVADAAVKLPEFSEDQEMMS